MQTVGREKKSLRVGFCSDVRVLMAMDAAGGVAQCGRSLKLGFSNRFGPRFVSLAWTSKAIAPASMEYGTERGAAVSSIGRSLCDHRMSSINPERMLASSHRGNPLWLRRSVTLGAKRLLALFPHLDFSWLAILADETLYCAVSTSSCCLDVTPHRRCRRHDAPDTKAR